MVSLVITKARSTQSIIRSRTPMRRRVPRCEMAPSSHHTAPWKTICRCLGRYGSAKGSYSDRSTLKSVHSYTRKGNTGQMKRLKMAHSWSICHIRFRIYDDWWILFYQSYLCIAWKIVGIKLQRSVWEQIYRFIWVWVLIGKSGIIRRQRGKGACGNPKGRDNGPQTRKNHENITDTNKNIFYGDKVKAAKQI